MIIIKLIAALFSGIIFCSLSHDDNIALFFSGTFLGYLLFSHFQSSKTIKLLSFRLSDLEERVRIISAYKKKTDSLQHSEFTETNKNTDSEEKLSDDIELEKPVDSSSIQPTPENSTPIETNIDEDHFVYENRTYETTSHNEESTGYNPEESRPLRELYPEENCENFSDKAAKHIVSLVKNYFTTGNTIVRIGIIILFFGIAFLLKYVSDHTDIPIEVRYYSAGALGFALLAIGWRLRKKNRGYSLSLQGGGIGIMYMTVFAALRISHLIPPEIAFILMIIIVLLSSVIAILQDSTALAVLSTLAGFSAPLLTSTGSGNFVHLFSYYLILNIGIAIIAWFKSWRMLNLLGFFFTFGVGLSWGIGYYKPENYGAIQPFLTLYFLLYSFISIVFTLKQNSKTAKYIDSTLIFGTPLATFGLQAAIVHDIDMGSGISAAVIGAYYLLITFIIFKKLGTKARLLLESFIALSIGFLTIAIPLISTNGKITSAAWATEATALIWIGVRQKRLLARIFGVLLVLASSIAYIYEFANSLINFKYNNIITPYLNSNFIGAIIVVTAITFIAIYLLKNKDLTSNYEKRALCYPLLVYGYIFWIISGLFEINFVDEDYQQLAAAVYYALTATVMFLISYRFRSILAFVLALITSFFVLIIASIAHLLFNRHSIPLVNNEFLSTIICCLPPIITAFYCIHRNRKIPLFVGKRFSFAYLCYGIILLLAGAVHDIYLKTGFEYWTAFSALLCGITLYLAGTSGVLLQWNQTKIIRLGIIPTTILFIILNIITDFSLHKGYGFIIFPLLIIIGIYAVYKNDKEKIIDSSAIQIIFTIGITYIFTWQTIKIFKFLIESNDKFFNNSLYGVIPTAVLGIILLNRNSKKWPINNHKICYNIYIPMILCALIGLWSICINMVAPKISVIPYIPIFNFCDIGHIIFIICLWVCYKHLLKDYLILKNEQIYSSLFAIIFVLINFVLFRSLYIYFGVPYSAKGIYNSNIAQSSMSVIWGIIGMGIMILSAKKSWRSVWICGAGIITILVVKLFIIDTSGIGTIARIVTFITVGIVLLITGYFAPVPPSSNNTCKSE